MPRQSGSLFLALWLALHPALSAAAALLFIAGGGSATSREFLLQQQSYYEALTLKEMNWQGETLTGFVALDNLGLPEQAPLQRAPLQEIIRTGHYTLADLCHQVEVVVALGGEAARAVAQDCVAPLLVVLTTQPQVSQLLNMPQRAPRSAIYLEADPILNLRLLRDLLPNAATVGVFVSPSSQVWLPGLRTAARQLQLRLDEIEVTTDDQAVRELRTRIGGLDALLLLPETTMVNAWSLKPILLTAARHYVPTFGGLTESYVNAGVLAAMVPDWDRLHAQISTVAARLAQGAVPAPAYPQATRLVINKTVARTLSIRVDAVEQRPPSPPP